MSERKDLCLLAGHAPKKDAALEAAISVAGVPQPRVAYIGAASGDNPLFFRWMKSSLKKAGAGSVVHVKLTGKKPDMSATLAALEESDCIHIGGGDVEAGMRILEDRDIVSKLRALYDEGRAFSGLSAGSIMLGSGWLRWNDPDDDDSIELFPCLGFAPFPCDTHAEEDDFEELRILLSRGRDLATGYGIPSGAGLLLRPDGAVSAVAGKVRVYEKTAGTVAGYRELFPG